jgi:hypothetical protein
MVIIKRETLSNMSRGGENQLCPCNPNFSVREPLLKLPEASADIIE